MNSQEPAKPERPWLRPRNIIGVLVLLVVLGVFFLVQHRAIARYEVVSASMRPTLKIGDRVFVTPPATGYYQVGDIVVVPDPMGSDEPLIKRIVAIGPDRVAVRDGQLYVNGVRSDPPQGATPSADVRNRSWRLTVDEAFVVGDNRTNSVDSREFGPVLIESLRGRAYPGDFGDFVKHGLLGME